MTYAACECEWDSSWDFQRSEVRTARKKYICDECHCLISPKEKYENLFGKIEGDTVEHRTCALCLELRNWAQISVPCFCWMYGEVHENVRSLVEEARRDMPPGWMFEWGRRMVPIRKRIEERRAAKRGMNS